LTTAEEQIVVCKRFADYYADLDMMDLKLGELEPNEIKAKRPFLLENEITSSGQLTQRKNGKNKGKGKDSKSAVMSKDKASTFSIVSNWKVGVNNYTPSNQPYRMTQELEALATLTSSTTLETFTSNIFRLSNLTNDSSFQAIFDQYRIEAIEAWIIPNNKNLNTSNDCGLMTSVIDYDDNTNLTSVALANVYPNAVVTSGSEGHYHKFTPHVAVAAYSGAFTSFANETAPWIDIASDGVLHYGVKTAWTATSVVMTYNILFRYHLAFRNVR